MAVAAATNTQTAHPAIPISFHSPAPSSDGSTLKVLVMSFHVGSAVVNDQTALLAKSAGVTTTTSSATMAWSLAALHRTSACRCALATPHGLPARRVG